MGVENYLKGLEMFSEGVDAGRKRKQAALQLQAEQALGETIANLPEGSSMAGIITSQAYKSGIGDKSLLKTLMGMDPNKLTQSALAGAFKDPNKVSDATMMMQALEQTNWLLSKSKEAGKLSAKLQYGFGPKAGGGSGGGKVKLAPADIPTGNIIAGLQKIYKENGLDIFQGQSLATIADKNVREKVTASQNAIIRDTIAAELPFLKDPTNAEILDALTAEVSTEVLKNPMSLFNIDVVPVKDDEKQITGWETQIKSPKVIKKDLPYDAKLRALKSLQEAKEKDSDEIDLKSFILSGD